jgi:predicted lipoprotein with Yx(FWY)xxD motif
MTRNTYDRRAVLAATAGALTFVLALTGCGAERPGAGDAGDATRAGAGPSPQLTLEVVEEPAVPLGSPAAVPDGTHTGTARPALGVLDSPGLGRVLQDRNGRTLYLFTEDTPWPMKTACDATCREKWTPSGLVTAADAKAAGLDPGVLFTFTTPDGREQESFNCWPAYTFEGDEKPGDTNGQGVGGTWFAIKADIPRGDRGRTVPAAKG